MRLKVRLSPEAAEDIREVVAYIRAQSGPRTATRWRQGLVAMIRSLDEMPLRGALVPEEEFAAEGVRQLIYYSHRIVYRVGEAGVEVARIYHSRRDRLSPEDPPDA